MSLREEAAQLRQDIENEQRDKLKIALFGQPGAGKSSLINQIVGQPVVKTGASTDMTTEAQVIAHDELLLVDLPGYGTTRFPPNQWMEQFKPEELDLFLCVFSGKFHEADSKFFKELREKGRICLFVRNKRDDLWEDGKTQEELEAEIAADVHRQVGSEEPVHFVSCRTRGGLAELVDAIYAALDPAKREKYARSAKAFSMAHLEAKRAACEKAVYKYAGLAAANGLNPIPGVNVGVDISIMFKLFADVRSAYGLTDEKVNKLIPSLLPLGKRVLDYSTKEGIALLLKRFAGKGASVQIGRFVPFIGQAVAAAAGFGLTLAAGKSYLNDCHELAERILAAELGIAEQP
ncbi:GTPase domain-containing protein [Cohnella nanjingensis]|uniref:50S ribosome-binding GTPase n=1 Tax=Cohnella nanjingensis TaxID=1387779 RepID=A0A7X0RWD8_9BACL|nr:GTPase domain-containing protein [Cohnella nanjingensis]MBB6673681.1 50S ribosome-binding GTPase [Cohnella nanjingensis]